MSLPEENRDRERLRQNVRRTVGQRALKEIGAIVDEDLRAEAARASLLRALLRHGWIILLLTALLSAYFTGVF